MKARVYQLAKELGRTSKDLIEILAELGIDVKNHMSTLSEDQVMRARAQVMPVEPKPKPAATKKVPKAPKKAPKKAPPKPAAPSADTTPPRPTPVPPAAPPRPATAPAAARTPPPPVRPGSARPRPRTAPPAGIGPSEVSPAERPPADSPPIESAPPATDGTAPPPRPAPPRPTSARPGPPLSRPAPPPSRPAPPPPQPGGRAIVPPGPPRRPVPGGGIPGVRRPGSPPPRPGSGGQLPPRPGGRVQRGPAGRVGGGSPGRGPGVAQPSELPPGGGAPGGGGPGRGRHGGGRGGPRGGGGGPRRSQYGGGGGQRPRPRLKRRELTESTVDLSSRASVEIHIPTTVRDFSAETGIRVPTLLTKLMQVGFMANINSALTEELVELLAVEFKFDEKLVLKAEEKAEDKLMAAFESEDKAEDLVNRAPIITFLGHVDHGKTSLLDAIRGSNVQSQEAGGITQHISAFRVTTKDGKQVVFLDTPGHEAFTKMRARGADVTDVVVLVVAADDGVMPQTKEAISHARAAGVKIVVALNKSDLPGANPDMVKTQLSTEGLQPEDWGGETVVVPTSAVSGEGVDDLLEFLALESELMDLKANPERRAQGHVLEASVSGGRGVLTTLLVKNGTLHVGDYLIAGQAMGRVRALMDSTGKQVKSAPPATPVEMLGLNEAPEAGEPFIVVEDEKQAKEVAAERLTKKRGAMSGAKPPSSIDELMKGIAEKKVKEVKVLVKADVQGSVEVLRKELSDLGQDEVKVTVIHAQVGGVNESDVLLAGASGAIIIGFNVIADERARQAADAHGVAMSFYSVIYKITEDLRAAMEGMLDPEEKEEIQGHVEIRKVFKISRLGNIAGCYVQDGIITRNSRIRLARDGIVIHDGKLDNLKREKNDAKEVRAGLECGLKLYGYDDIKVGDTLEAFTIVKVKRTLGQ